MYDVDGNGVIDIQEMTKIVQVCKLYNCYPNKIAYKMIKKIDLIIIIDICTLGHSQPFVTVLLYSGLFLLSLLHYLVGKNPKSHYKFNIRFF